MGPKKKKAGEGAAAQLEPEQLAEGYEDGWDLKQSRERTAKYAEAGMKNKDVYLTECARLGKKPNSMLTATLEQHEGPGHTLKELNLNGNLIGNVVVLLDLIRLNTEITKIFLKDNGIQNNAVPLLCQALIDHPGVQVLDLTGNRQVGYVAGKALLMLVQRNPRIHSVRIGKTGIPPGTKEKIDAQALMNYNRMRISRRDYLTIRTDFKHADKDGNGTVQLSELMAHERHKLETQLRQKQKITDPKAAEKERAKKIKEQEEKIKQAAQKMFEKLDRDGDQRLTLPEFMRFYYTNIPEATLNLFIEQYEKEDQERGSEALSEEKIIELFEKFDVNHDGGLTKAELLQGLQTHAGEVEAIFKEYDLDGTDQLQLGEFIMFMAKRGVL